MKTDAWFLYECDLFPSKCLFPILVRSWLRGQWYWQCDYKILSLDYFLSWISAKCQRCVLLHVVSGTSEQLFLQWGRSIFLPGACLPNTPGSCQHFGRTHCSYIFICLCFPISDLCSQYIFVKLLLQIKKKKLRRGFLDSVTFRICLY